MDNTYVADILIAIVLIAGAVAGWERGLFKSLMGLVTVVAAMILAVLLADALTAPITDAVAPVIVDSLTESFSDALEQKGEDAAAQERGLLSERLERYGFVGEAAGKLLAPLEEGAQDMAQSAKQKAVDAFREAITSAVYALVRGVVHAALLLALYFVLLLALKLATKTLDLVFDLPVLSTVNSVGGAALGLLEAAALLYVVIYAAMRLGAPAVVNHTEDSLLLPFFVNHSPVELISNL